MLHNACIAFCDGIITYIGTEAVEAEKVIDAHGAYLVPGFVDIHCHGGAGLQLNGIEGKRIDADGVKTIAEYHLSRGTTTLLPTTTTSSMQDIENALACVEEHLRTEKITNVAGIHMEGPWLSSAQCGAQDTKNMISPSARQLRELKEKYPSIIRVGAAPELDGGMEFGEAAKALGINASVAHSDATFAEIGVALEHGYNLMTHLYSGMKGTERKNAYRIAGAVEGGLYFDDMYVEIIADGKHLPLELLKYIYKFKGRDKICLITDAVRAAGLPNGTVIKDGDSIVAIVEDDVAKVPDRSCFAGSAATTDRLYRTMAEAIGRDFVSLSRMASLTPARLMGFTDRGELAVGKRADIVILNDSLSVERVILNGNAVN